METNEVKQEKYGEIDGRDVRIFTLTNSHGMRARVTEFGAILVSLETPDRDGKLADLTLGYDSLADWEINVPYFGSTVGRYGNRIADGKFNLDGKEYTLVKNNEAGGISCHLHGGKIGFNKVIWTGEATSRLGAQGVILTYVSEDGEEGYPGNLSVKVTYWLNDQNELIWETEATTDKATPVNIVNHSYWNLSGHPEKTINDHELELEAEYYLPINAGLIPTGELAPVKGTPMDFTSLIRIGNRVEEDFEALKLGAGYDHCWCLREAGGIRSAAKLYDPVSGRIMEILTNQPGIQFYSGNFLDETAQGKGGVNYSPRSGLCLETQKFPDSPNQSKFPSSILKPGEIYKHVMIHRFSIRD